MKKKWDLSLVLNALLFAVFIGLLIYGVIRLAPEITRIAKDPAGFRNYLLGFGSLGVLVFIGFQVLQIVVFVIAGEVIQIPAGYLYGAVWGTVYSMIGLILGMALVFLLSRLFGYTFIRRVIPQKSLDKFDFLINSPKSEIALFIFFLVPGLPKDVLIYIAGLTPVKPLRFLGLATIARFPGILGCAVIGNSLQKENWLLVGIVSAISLLLFVAGLFYRNRIVNWVHRISTKNHTEEPSDPT